MNGHHTSFAHRPGARLRALAAGLACLLPALVAAQGMDEAQMQQMMQQAQKMQECMGKVDQAALQKMAAEGEAFQHKVKGLCAAGKRKQAMSEAMAYAKDVGARPEVKQMRECGKMMKGMMPPMPIPEAPKDDGTHICDGF